MAYDSDSTAWAVGQDGAILYWDGSTWLEFERPVTKNLLAVDALSTDFAWAVGETGTILRWNGTAWQLQTSVTTKNLWDIHFVHPAKGWAAASTGSMVFWNGTTWAVKNITGVVGNLYAVDMITSTVTASNDFGLAVGSTGTWLKWNPTTKVWENQITFTSNDLYGVSIIADDNAWAVGQGGVIYQWNGSSWSEVRYPIPSEPDLNAVYMVDANNGLAAGNNGVLLRWNGSTWSSVSTGTQLDLNALDFNASETAALLVGEGGKNMLWNTSSASILQNAIAGYLELQIPNTSIGMGPSTGSMSVALISLNGTTPVDTVPSNANPTSLKYFTSASERMNLRTPLDIAIIGSTPTDPRTQSSILPYFYDYPVQSLWGGTYIETHNDANFTT